MNTLYYSRKGKGKIMTIVKRLLKEVKIWHYILLWNTYMKTADMGNTVNRFHRLYYDSGAFGQTWRKTTFLGTEISKCPLDLWIYQEIIFDLRPDVIIETGTYLGGSALYMASICDLISHGRVLTIDIKEKDGRPHHERITYITGSSTSNSTVQKVKHEIEGCSSTMVVLDSDHTKYHVLNELNIYGDIVTKGSYLIVEDSNLNGHPVEGDFGEGPMEAIEEFLQKNDKYVVDKTKEKLLLTFNPNGYLRRIKE